MATIESVMKLQDKMSAQLDRIEQAALKTNTAFQKVSISVDNVDKKMKNSEKSSTSFFSSLLKFEILKGVFSSVFGLITSQLGEAINRFDTLNNYTNVMSNLGVGLEEAEKSRERLAEGLKGLPTKLDTGVKAVQRFVAANSDVEASTEMYLAMNNALLAGGTSAETQAGAMEQLAQAYSKGKPDMMEWRALLTAMPGQLKQIAKAMGKTTNELGADLRSGKTSMNEFMKTAIKLNQEGVDGFANFQEQAQNATKGINTAISNMQAAIQRGWTKMIENTNNSLKASGLPTIDIMIKQIGENIEATMARLGESTIPALIQGVASVGNAFNQVDASVNDLTNDSVKNLGVLDFFALGLQAVGLGADVVWNAIKTVAQSIRVIFMTLGADLNTVYANMLYGIADTVGKAAMQVQDFINGVIDVLNQLVEAYNNTFGNMLGKMDKLNEVTFGTEYYVDMSIAAKQQELIANELQTMKQDAKIDMYTDATESVERWRNSVADMKSTLKSLKEATKETTTTAGGGSTYDYNNIDKLTNTVGTDSTGGKAVKTTTNDDLLKDEDIQLLLDVATRDYKLNYQQVTPNITLTFGDIRETADVDDILDQVADRLEEIYDSNLEVVQVGN